MPYKTPVKFAEVSITERKSEFIARIAPVTEEKAALLLLDEIKTLHRKARHNCFAYIIRESNVTRFSDDGEPQGTAGMPILETISQAGLTDVVCVVTRYFGGILLGANGLVRAYSKAASLAVAEADVRLMSPARKVYITLEYSIFSKVERLFNLPGVSIAEKDFSETVRLTVYTAESISDKFNAILSEATNGTSVVEFIQNEYYSFG